ncbi:MAG: cupredoxin family protein [Burkholderiales bacterium]|nr:cupredoxin family protein [Burkholderiales bacterium]
MNKSLSILLLSAFPVLALAAGNQSDGHGQDMVEMHKNMAGMHQGANDSAAGMAGDPAKVSRTIGISMDDTMRFTPEQISVKVGETIRFFVKNAGKLDHEMVIGTSDELKAHAEMMRAMPGMKHAERNMIALASGQRGGIVWQFDKAGQVDFACLIPGHSAAGMAGKIQVE